MLLQKICQILEATSYLWSSSIHKLPKKSSVRVMMIIYFIEEEFEAIERCDLMFLLLKLCSEKTNMIPFKKFIFCQKTNYKTVGKKL